MWLLNVHTRKLDFFVGDASVSGGYTVLSHTWAEEEVTFDNIQAGDCSSKEGYGKIDFACVNAMRDGYKYVWVVRKLINQNITLFTFETWTDNLIPLPRIPVVLIRDLQPSFQRP